MQNLNIVSEPAAGMLTPSTLTIPMPKPVEVHIPVVEIRDREKGLAR